MNQQSKNTLNKLLDAPALLAALFDEASRPSMRTLRAWQKSKIIPSVKLGRLVFFNPAQVSAALEKRTRGLAK